MTFPPIEEAVTAFNSTTLVLMLETAGVEETPHSKVNKVALWIRLLGDPQRIERALARVTPRCRQALQLLQAHGGELSSQRYNALLLQAGLVLRSRQSGHSPTPQREEDPKTFDQVLATLLLEGLIWSHTNPNPNSKLSLDGGVFVYIPTEIAEHLPPAPPVAPQQIRIQHILEGSARTFQRDLYLYWSEIRHSSPALTVAGLLRLADLRKLASKLLVPEPVPAGSKESSIRRLLFLRFLLFELDALHYQDTAESALVKAVEDVPFFQAEPLERVRRCYSSWLAGQWWNELWATYVQGQTRAAGTLYDPAGATAIKARQTVVNTLIRHTRTAGEWIAFDELSSDLADHAENLLIDHTDSKPAYWSSYGYNYQASYLYNPLGWEWQNLPGEPGAGWERVERVFIEAVLSEGLYWLGLVDLGYADPITPEGGTPPKGWTAVRLTDMGRWLLLGEPPPQLPAEQGRVVVQPNYRILAFDPVPDTLLARLDRFASRVRADRTTEYELTHESVYRAQLAGLSASEIGTWLEQVSGMPLPQNVARTLEEWQASYERISLYTGVGLVHVGAPELIDALLALPESAQAVVSRLSPTLLLVRSESMPALEQALLAADELPIRSATALVAVPGSITIDDEGYITSRQGEFPLAVLGILQTIAQQDTDRWRLTPASVRRAHDNGLGAEQLIASLRNLVPSLPKELESRIKAWSGHYGEAWLQTRVVVRFRDHRVLDELLADPELSRLLKPLPRESASARALARPQDVERLRKLLLARGVDVREENSEQAKKGAG